MVNIMRKYSKIIKYIVCVAASVILVVTAIMGPQLLLTAQDNYQLGKSWQGKRVSLDMEALNNSYGSMRERLLSFAAGVAQEKDYYVAGTDYQATEEIYDIIEQVFEQEIIVMLMDLSGFPFYFPELLEKEFDIAACKKCFIYDASFDEGVTSIVAMAWYIELKVTDAQYIKILADVEKNTVYYVEYVYEENVYEENVGFDKAVNYMTTGVSAKRQEMLSTVFYYMYPLCYAYYEAGLEEALTEMEVWEDYNEDNAFYGESWTYGNGVASVQAEMPYGNNGNFLTWEMGMHYNDEKLQTRRVYLGIREIKELIPEFQ